MSRCGWEGRNRGFSQLDILQRKPSEAALGGQLSSVHPEGDVAALFSMGLLLDRGKRKGLAPSEMQQNRTCSLRKELRTHSLNEKPAQSVTCLMPQTPTINRGYALGECPRNADHFEARIMGIFCLFFFPRSGRFAARFLSQRWSSDCHFTRALPREPLYPLCDTASGCCSFTGPWTVTRSSLRMLRWVGAFCRPLRPVFLLVSFPRSRSPVVGTLGVVRVRAGVALRFLLPAPLRT